MLDHLSIPVADLEASAVFYDHVLATLGYERRKAWPNGIGYGPPTRPAPVFWILQAEPGQCASAGTGLHISFQAASHDIVDAFHAEGLRQGGSDAGPPGDRPHYTRPFYGAFIFDPDGFKIEAVCRASTTA